GITELVHSTRRVRMMRALNDLVIRGPSPEVASFLRRLEGSLSGGWRRDRALEARLHGGVAGVRGLARRAACGAGAGLRERARSAVELRRGAAPLMPTLAAVAADLLAKPRPVLCLDTCELLMAVQCLPQPRFQVEALNRTRSFLAATPECPQRVT